MTTITWQHYYNAPKPELWIGRADSLPRERYFQIVECCDLRRQFPVKENSFAILGFACDAGVKRNSGATGAKLGPDGFRQAFTHLAQHLPDNCVIYDVGNIVCDNDDLEAAQESLGEVIYLLNQKNIKPLVIGGGHEIAFGHYQGLEKSYPQQDIGIVNIDAHFDLRPILAENRGSSGTPFLQIAEQRRRQQLNFAYHVIGIQASANTRSLFQRAQELNVLVTLAAEIHDPATFATTVSRLNHFIEQHDKIYFTICLDAIAMSYAPGVSGPQINGLLPQHVLTYLERVVSSGKIIGFDIAELSPPLDHQKKTALLCATLVDRYLQAHFS
ncbi:MAG: formimidoylglutamase [Legionellales bacterium]|nr:formimidoylglutamase [Legionellales bacterium]